MTEQTWSRETDHPPWTNPAQIRPIRFVEHAGNDAAVLMRFTDPAPCQAVDASRELSEALAKPDSLDRDAIDVLTIPSSARDEPSAREQWSYWLSDAPAGDALPKIVLNFRGAEVAWQPGRAALQALPEQIEPLLAAIVEFSFYENELRKLEGEVAAAWPDLEVDKRLAYEVTTTDLEQQDVVGRRVELALQRRIRHARIEPHLYRPGAHLSALAQNLGEQLREKARVEDRLEIIDGQLEVFEHIYEMTSQRMGEFRAARQEHTLEWVIIFLLAAEALLLLADVLWTFEV